MVNDFLDKSGIMALWNRAKSIFITAESPAAIVDTVPVNADLLDTHPVSYFLNITDVVDNLTFTSTTNLLSANQGKVLNETKPGLITKIVKDGNTYIGEIFNSYDGDFGNYVGGNYSHAEGKGVASGDYSHEKGEGIGTSGDWSNTEFVYMRINGLWSEVI